MAFSADYFNGISAQARSVSVMVIVSGDPSIVFGVETETLHYALADLKVQAKLGAAKRIIDLPDGGRLEAQDIHDLEAMLSSKTSAFWTMVHTLENHLGWVVVLLLATVLIGWSFLQYGIPKLAEYVVKATPASMETKLGEQILNGLDHHKVGYFAASKLQLPRQQQLNTEVKTFCQIFQHCPNYRLEFRRGGKIGANAFALPGGIVLVTDELVALSKNDAEIIAVLVHEFGHVQQRHAFRQSIQSLLSGLVVAAITGDVNSLASGLGGVLIQMRYSQAHETEADNFALKALQKTCLSPRIFADILPRLEQSHAEREDNRNKEAVKPSAWQQKITQLTDLFSSHPDTAARIQPFLLAQQPLCSLDNALSKSLLAHIEPSLLPKPL